MRCYQYLISKASASDFQVFCPSKHYLHLNLNENYFMQSSVLYLHQFSSYQAASSVSACPTTRKPGLLQVRKNILNITSIKGKRQFFRHIISYVFLYNEIKTYCLVLDKTTSLSLSVSKLDILAEKNATTHISFSFKQCMCYRELIIDA